LISVNVLAAKDHDICIYWEHQLGRRHDMKQALVILAAIAFMTANVSSAFSETAPATKTDTKSGKKSSNTDTTTPTGSGQTKK
jgi:hypothetical protein